MRLLEPLRALGPVGRRGRASRQARRPVRSRPKTQGPRGRAAGKDRSMHTVRLAGLLGLAALGAQAQVSPTLATHPFEPLVITAARTITDPLPTLRDAVVITRDE